MERLHDDGGKELNLSVELCGLSLANPLILASGPLSSSAEAVQAAFKAGAAAVVTKTISSRPAVNPVPHIARVGKGILLNMEGWSDLTPDAWIEKGLPALRERDGILIASVGHTAADAKALAGPLEAAGADAIEVVSYSAEDMPALVRSARAAVDIPILAKISPNWPNVLEVVEEVLREGADGITAIDSVGPALRIDVFTGRPVLNRPAWLSGRPIRPIAQRIVADIALRYDVPVVGTGGVIRGKEAIEMLMAGATAVGVHTAPLLQGLGFFRKALDEMRKFMEAQGYTDIAQISGFALPCLQAPPKATALTFSFDAHRCTLCNLCVDLCPYQARHLVEDTMQIDLARCRFCGLCATVCPQDAISYEPVHEKDLGG